MVAFLFPGQGSQQSGAALLFRDACAETRSLFEISEEILSPEVFDALLNGSQEMLKETRYAQPALVCVEAAATAFLRSLRINPTVCAGHSLGEISALVAAGALRFEDALFLVTERARLMSENVPEGGMAAVIGLESVSALEAALPDTVQIANYNGPSQTIISGTKAGLEEAAAALKAVGAKRVLPLAVSGPFHSRYMEPAGKALAEVLKRIPISAPAVVFISSVSGQAETDPDRIRTLLSEQLFCPVRWTDVMEALVGCKAIEAGPGAVLQGLAKRMPQSPEVYSGATPDLCRESCKLLEASI